MTESMTPAQQKIYEWLQKHGGNDGAVEFRPHEYLRKTGFLAVQEGIERVKADLMQMEEDGWVLIGAKTETGHLVMLTDKQTEIMLLPFERMVAAHASMSDAEREMLQQWEQTHLGGPEQLATSDWPGWRVVFKRLAH